MLRDRHQLVLKGLKLLAAVDKLSASCVDGCSLFTDGFLELIALCDELCDGVVVRRSVLRELVIKLVARFADLLLVVYSFASNPLSIALLS